MIGKRFGRLPAVLGLCTFVTGCMPAFYTPLADDKRAKINELEMRVVVVQEGPVFSARAPGVAAAAGGGLIPALIDAGIQQSRQQELGGRMRPALDAIDGYDFRAEYAAGLDTALKSFPLKVNKHAVTPRALTREQTDAAIAATKGGKAFLMLITSYELEPGLGTLSIRTSASLWNDGAVEKIYSNHFIFQSSVQGLSPAENAKLWSADGAKVYREQSALGARETLKMLAMDLQMKGVIKEPPGQSEMRMSVAGAPRFMQAKKIDGTTARSVFRDADGALYSLQ